MRRFSFFRALHAIMPLVIFYIVKLCAEYAASRYGDNGSNIPISPTWILIISYSLVALILYVTNYKKDYLPLKLSKKLPLTFFLGAFAAIAFNLLIAYICVILRVEGVFVDSPSTRKTTYLLGIVLFGFIAPLMEEVMFRWLMYGRIKLMVGKIIAPVITSLFFGLYHGNLIQAIYAFIMGLIMIIIYECCQSLLAPLLFHMGANITMFSLPYLPVKFSKVIDSPAACFVTFVLGTIIILYIYNHKEAGNV